jgi:hypothetical protein
MHESPPLHPVLSYFNIVLTADSLSVEYIYNSVIPPGIAQFVKARSNGLDERGLIPGIGK